MSINAQEALVQFERTNNIQEINSADEIYAYDSAAQQAIRNSHPWRQK